MTPPTEFRTFEVSDPALERDGLRHVTVKSAALGQRADITLFVPQSIHQQQPLRLVILLHGVYGSHWAWALKGGAHLTAARMMGSAEIAPMVLAMPSDGLWGDGSGYVPHGTAPNFERWIVEEVPAAAKLAVPELDSASPLFIAGLSMGGFGAIRLAAKNPTRFAAVSGHSSMTLPGQFDALVQESRSTWHLAPGDGGVLAAIAATQSAGHAPMPALRFDCGTSDPFLDANRQLHQQLGHLGLAHEYHEFEGGHEWPYWSRHLQDSLRFFNRFI